MGRILSQDKPTFQVGNEFRIGLQWFLKVHISRKIKLPTFECERIHSYASQPICIKLVKLTNSFPLSNRSCSMPRRNRKILFEPSLIFNFIGNYQLEPYPYLDTNSLTSFIIAAHTTLAERHKTHTTTSVNTGQFKY